MNHSSSLPVEPEQLLPKEAYLSGKWLELEQKHLFSNTWTYAGTVTDIPARGSYKTLLAGVYPLFVLRTSSDEIRAFHNLCRHRGTELLEGSGEIAGTIVCPYHRWSYNLDGSLRGVPNQKECFPGLDKSIMSLLPASVGIYKDMIFVHPSDKPGITFEEWLAGLENLEWPHDIKSGDMVASDEITYEMKCNWKVFYENAIDGYHLGYLHENTLGTVTPDNNVWEAYGQHVVWYSTERDGEKNTLPTLVETYMTQASASKLPGTEPADYPGVYMMFPTTIITPNPYGISISQLVPKGPEVCWLVVRTWRPADSDYRSDVSSIPGYDPDSGLVKSDFWDKHPLETGDFHTEDVWVCEKMQRSLRSPRYSVGALARGAGAEAPLTHFQRSILDFLPQDVVREQGKSGPVLAA